VPTDYVNVLRRKSPKRPTFGNIDRLIFAGLYSLAPNVRSALAADGEASGSLLPARFAIGKIRSARTRSACRARSSSRRFSRFVASSQSYSVCDRDKRDHCAPTLGDSLLQSIRIGFSVHTGLCARKRNFCGRDEGAETASLKFNRRFAETKRSYTLLRHFGHFASQGIPTSGPVAQCSELAADNRFGWKFESSRPHHASFLA
jgi:hypothetical protein